MVVVDVIVVVVVVAAVVVVDVVIINRHTIKNKPELIAWTAIFVAL